VVLAREEHGKPCLRPPQPLHFNLSHAGDHLLLAFSPTARLGVDLERVRPLAHAERIARRAFSPQELDSWLGLDAPERLTGFFERWTRMEALAKLLGFGVWRLLAEGGSAPGVSFHPLIAPPGSIATLAVDEPAARVLERHYPL
jgi:4'-phosphopantetheinyl transferase